MILSAARTTLLQLLQLVWNIQLNVLCIRQELELYDYEKDTTQKTFLPTFTCSIVWNHSVLQGGLQSCHNITTAENRAFDLMWISKHHKPVFRFPARLPGLVAKAGCSFLRIPRLSTATSSHFLLRPEFCWWVLSYPCPQNLWQDIWDPSRKRLKEATQIFTLRDTVVFTAKWSRTTFERRF